MERLFVVGRIGQSKFRYYFSPSTERFNLRDRVRDSSYLEET